MNFFCKKQNNIEYLKKSREIFINTNNNAKRFKLNYYFNFQKKIQIKKKLKIKLIYFFDNVLLLEIIIIFAKKSLTEGNIKKNKKNINDIFIKKYK